MDDHAPVAPVIHRQKKFVFNLRHALYKTSVHGSNFGGWKPERGGRERKKEKITIEYPTTALIGQSSLVLVTHLTTLSDAQTLTKTWRTRASLLRDGVWLRSDMH